jgi:hypothetical protein
LGIEPLSVDDVELILATAQKYQTRTATETRPVRQFDLLRGKTLVLAFFEPSTRTRVSFEMAAQRLGMHTVNLALEASSVQKGESLLDTIKTLVAMRPDALVIRHSGSGVPHFLARHLGADSQRRRRRHEHPTGAAHASPSATTRATRRPQIAISATSCTAAWPAPAFSALQVRRPHRAGRAAAAGPKSPGEAGNGCERMHANRRSA